MKTSNKLLIAVATLLIMAAVVNALTLKQQFNAAVTTGLVELRDFPVERFNRIELSGTAPQQIGGRLRVAVKRADRFNVTYTAFDFVRIDEENETLKIGIDYDKEFDSSVKRIPQIIIECPHLEAFTAKGTPLDSLDLSPATHEATKRYIQKSEVAIAGFQGTGLRIAASDGMEVILDALKVDSLTVSADHAAAVTMRQNALGHAILTVGDDATITLDRSQISTLTTDIAEKGQFIVTGTQLTAHGKHH